MDVPGFELQSRDGKYWGIGIVTMNWGSIKIEDSSHWQDGLVCEGLEIAGTCRELEPIESLIGFEVIKGLKN